MAVDSRLGLQWSTHIKERTFEERVDIVSSGTKARSVCRIFGGCEIRLVDDTLTVLWFVSISIGREIHVVSSSISVVLRQHMLIQLCVVFWSVNRFQQRVPNVPIVR